MILTFPFTVEPAEQGVILCFPDFPEAQLVAANRGDALKCALPLLEAVLQTYVDSGREIPQPRLGAGQLLATSTRFAANSALQCFGTQAR